MDPSSSDLILVDAHVHLHRCFDLVPLLDAAYANFRSVAQRLHPGTAWLGVLVVTDGATDDGFERVSGLQKNPLTEGEAPLGRWHLQSTKERTSLVLRGEGRAALVVLAGRQIRSRENLEVLAIGTCSRFEEGQPVENVIHEVTRVGALPVIPWGFGKWTGARGRLLKQLLRNAQLPPFFVADNANRLAFWPRSPLFHLAEARGIKNLPGSDPFPFPDECERPGGFGFVLQGSLSSMAPMEDLRRRLFDPRCVVQPYGSGARLFRFVRNQLAIQVRKLAGRGNQTAA